MAANNLMERRIAILERHCSRLTFAVLTISIIWAVTVLLCVILFPVAHVHGDTAPGVLKVRALVVVDEKGSERVRIGAPIAGPSNSSLPMWRTPVSGIILYGPDGKERAGFVTIIKVEIVNHEKTLESRGHVIYSQSNMGMAVAFDELSARDTQILENWLHQLKG